VQTSIEFTIRDGEDNERYMLYDEKAGSKASVQSDSRKREDRVKKLKETHEKLKEEGYNGVTTNDKIEELENQPAYLRKKVKLEDEGNRPSADNPVSRYTLSDDENNIPRLREDNSYLHDNVD
jgi:predicted RNase H-like nuclease (RuvC/YqgF family)